MRSAWIFTDDGRCWPEGHPALARALQTNRRGSALSDFAVRNLGFVRVERRRRGSLVAYCPFTVSDVALATLGRWLRGQGLERVALSAVGAATPCRIVATDAVAAVAGRPEAQPAARRAGSSAADAGTMSPASAAANVVSIWARGVQNR
jgi:predicted transcriptional regulator